MDSLGYIICYSFNTARCNGDDDDVDDVDEDDDDEEEEEFHCQLHHHIPSGKGTIAP